MKYLGAVLLVVVLGGCKNHEQERVENDMKLIVEREKTKQMQIELEKDRLGKVFALCMKMVEQQKDTKMPINCNLSGRPQ